MFTTHFNPSNQDNLLDLRSSNARKFQLDRVRQIREEKQLIRLHKLHPSRSRVAAIEYLPDLELPSFNGTRPTEWLTNCDFYFDYYQTPERYKVQTGAIRFSGEAAEWFKCYNYQHPNMPWSVFVADVFDAFRECSPVDPCVQNQQTIYQSIEEQLSQLMSLLKAWRSDLTGTNLIMVQEEVPFQVSDLESSIEEDRGVVPKSGVDCSEVTDDNAVQKENPEQPDIVMSSTTIGESFDSQAEAESDLASQRSGQYNQEEEELLDVAEVDEEIPFQETDLTSGGEILEIEAKSDVEYGVITYMGINTAQCAVVPLVPPLTSTFSHSFIPLGPTHIQFPSEVIAKPDIDLGKVETTEVLILDPPKRFASKEVTLSHIVLNTSNSNLSSSFVLALFYSRVTSLTFKDGTYLRSKEFLYVIKHKPPDCMQLHRPISEKQHTFFVALDLERFIAFHHHSTMNQFKWCTGTNPLDPLLIPDMSLFLYQNADVSERPCESEIHISIEVVTWHKKTELKDSRDNFASNNTMIMPTLLFKKGDCEGHNGHFYMIQHEPPDEGNLLWLMMKSRELLIDEFTSALKEGILPFIVVFIRRTCDNNFELNHTLDYKGRMGTISCCVAHNSINSILASELQFPDAFILPKVSAIAEWKEEVSFSEKGNNDYFVEEVIADIEKATILTLAFEIEGAIRQGKKKVMLQWKDHPPDDARWKAFQLPNPPYLSFRFSYVFLSTLLSLGMALICRGLMANGLDYSHVNKGISGIILQLVAALRCSVIFKNWLLYCGMSLVTAGNLATMLQLAFSYEHTGTNPQHEVWRVLKVNFIGWIQLKIDPNQKNRNQLDYSLELIWKWSIVTHQIDLTVPQVVATFALPLREMVEMAQLVPQLVLSILLIPKYNVSHNQILILWQPHQICKFIREGTNVVEKGAMQRSVGELRVTVGEFNCIEKGRSSGNWIINNRHEKIKTKVTEGRGPPLIKPDNSFG